MIRVDKLHLRTLPPHPNTHAMVLTVPVTVTIQTFPFICSCCRNHKPSLTHIPAVQVWELSKLPLITRECSFSVHRCSCDLAGPNQLPNREVEGLHIGDLGMDVAPPDSRPMMVGDKEMNPKLLYSLVFLL